LLKKTPMIIIHLKILILLWNQQYLSCVINSFASYNQFTHFLQSELFFWCKKMTTVLFIIPSKNQGIQFSKLKAWLYKTIKKIQQVSLNLE